MFRPFFIRESNPSWCMLYFILVAIRKAKTNSRKRTTLIESLEMEKVITAVYENGVLRPLSPLSLPEKAHVRLRLEDEIDDASDPVLSLIGAFSSQAPLIDGIAVSEDPALYAIAEGLGDEANGRHAWEIAPERYRKGANGKAVRIEDGLD